MDKKSFFHDHGYKYLFSNTTLVRYLVTGFVKDEWVKELDFTSIEKLDKEFIDKKYQKRESDIIYKVYYRGAEAYLYLMIEFQSQVDQFMALRVLHYICKLYLDILERNEYKFLSPVFPVVLYNGDEDWTAPLEFSELIEGRGKADFGAYLPRFKYYKIAENEFSKESLLKLNNLASALFYIENSSKGELKEAIDQVIDIIMSEQDKKAVSRFITWIKNFAERKQLKDDEGVNYHLTNPSEVKNMLATTLEQLRREAIAEGKIEGEREGLEKGIKKGIEKGIEKGLKKGRKRGREEGKKEGIVELIEAYLIARFDKAPEDFLARLKGLTDIGELEKVSLQIYKCRDLDEIAKLL